MQEPEDDELYVKTCYPFVRGYAITICKSQGQALENVVVWFDTNSLGEGVALSRVSILQSITFLTPLQLSHFYPVTL